MYMSEPSPNPDTLTDAHWQRLARYAAGESSAQESAEVREWVQADPARAKLVEAINKPAPWTSELRDSDIEAALLKVKARMRETQALKFEPRRVSIVRSPALRIAAGIVIVAGAAVILRNGSTSLVMPSVATAEHFTSPVGASRIVHLRDGSTVLLAPNSRLDVASSFRTGNRSVSLTGGGYFDVRHDPAHPFRASIASVTVRDIGTSFVLRETNGLVRVAVTTGIVGVRPIGSENETVLKAGGLAIASGNAVTVICCNAGADDVAWTKGKLIFRNAPLPEVSTEVYRWYGVHIQAGDSSIAARHITASFAGEPVNEVLRVIALTLGASVERAGDLAILRTGVSSAPVR
jgi:Fe2+-dicitrate sensor, membrane component